MANSCDSKKYLINLFNIYCVKFDSKTIRHLKLSEYNFEKVLTSI